MTNIVILISPALPDTNFQDQPQKTPIFCFHSIEGAIEVYKRKFIPIFSEYCTRPVYGVLSIGLTKDPITNEYNCDKIPSTIEEMAALYAKEIKKIQPIGPYIFLGWSFGGLLAKAVADFLENEGNKVTFVGIIDSPSPDATYNLNTEKRINAFESIANFYFERWKQYLKDDAAIPSLLTTLRQYTNPTNQIETLINYLANSLDETTCNASELKFLKAALKTVACNLKAIYTKPLTNTGKKSQYQTLVISTSDTQESYDLNEDLGWKKHISSEKFTSRSKSLTHKEIIADRKTIGEIIVQSIEDAVRKEESDIAYTVLSGLRLLKASHVRRDQLQKLLEESSDDYSSVISLLTTAASDKLSKSYKQEDSIKPGSPPELDKFLGSPPKVTSFLLPRKSDSPTNRKLNYPENGNNSFFSQRTTTFAAIAEEKPQTCENKMSHN